MRKKLIPVFLLILLVMFIIPVSAEAEAEEAGAEEESTDVTLTYHMAVSDNVELTVSVRGTGELQDGDGIIRNGVNVYELKPDANKEFNIVPDAGSEVASLMINKEEAADKYDDKIKIKGIRKDTSIKIIFEKLKGNMDGGNNGSADISQNQNKEGQIITSNGILTGESQSVRNLFLLLFISASIMLYMKRKKKGKDSETQSEGGNHE